MSSTFHFEAPTPLAYFTSLVANDSDFVTLEAAVCVAQDEFPALDVQGVLAEIDQLGERLKKRIPPDAAPLFKLRFLNRFYFQEMGFAGNVNDYYDPRNSYLNVVLQVRRGIPITLALLYMELASQVGLVAKGVSFPGHFLVKMRMARGEVVIDPLTGQSLSREELDERLGPYRRQRGLVGDFEAPLGLFLQAAAPRDIIARLLRNLKEIHRSNEDWPRLLNVQQRLIRLLPQAWEEVRDRGLVHAELGVTENAVADLQLYLQHHPDANDAAALRERIFELQWQSGPTRH
jgi:regulator of sirC expression with transglutaminase-like and TPR domain